MEKGTLEKGCTINGITLRNITKIKRKCLICKQEFKTTIGGAHICPNKKCQEILEFCSSITEYRVVITTTENTGINRELLIE